MQADDAPFSGPNGDDEDWLDSAPPDRPFDVLASTMFHLDDLTAEYGIGGRGLLSHSAALVNRMIYATAIAAMEAYLGDTLVNQVMSDPVAIKRMLTQDKDLTKMKFSLEELVGKPFFVDETIRTYLKTLLYHNLAKVEVLYKIATNFAILPDPLLRARLYKAVLLRHDIVHRNGKDVDGAEVAFPTADVIALISDIRTMAQHIETCVVARIFGHMPSGEAPQT